MGELNFNLEKRESKFGLPEELVLIREGLKFESSVKLVPLAVFQLANKSLEIKIGKKYLYISRVDVSDPDFTRGYKIPIQVARLEVGDDNSINKVIIDNEKLVGQTFGLLAESRFFMELISIFNLSIDREADLEEYIESVNKQAEAQAVSAKEIFDLRPKISIIRPEKDMNLEAVDVPQGFLFFIDEKSPERYIKTIGAGPCIVIIGYDNITHTVGVAHADAFSDAVGMARRIVSKAKDKIIILGGQPESLKQLIKLKSFFDHNDIPVEEWDILNETKSVAVDKKDGTIFNLKRIT